MRAQFGREWLEEEYVRKHRTLKDMGRECNVSGETIRYALKEFGIEYVPPGKRIDAAWVKEQVERGRRSYRAVAEELGVGHATISRLCRENGIKRRGGPGMMTRRAEKKVATACITCEDPIE